MFRISRNLNTILNFTVYIVAYLFILLLVFEYVCISIPFSFSLYTHKHTHALMPLSYPKSNLASSSRTCSPFLCSILANDTNQRPRPEASPSPSPHPSQLSGQVLLLWLCHVSSSYLSSHHYLVPTSSSHLTIHSANNFWAHHVPGSPPGSEDTVVNRQKSFFLITFTINKLTSMLCDDKCFGEN